RRAFVIPFFIDSLLLFFLLLLSYFLGGSKLEKILVTVIFIPVLYVLFESAFRMVGTGNQGIVIRKFMRKKEFKWEEITHIGALILRKRVYLLLTTVRGFYILSNAYERFSALVNDFANHMDREKVEAEVVRQIEYPAKNMSDIVMTWFTALVLVGIISIKLFIS
ncbi:MAG TPA: hypothetical protein VLZ07_00195, partial [Syntrophales bacterium]|nr:hypothetical protein [Syntrophales bacterium]